MTTKQSYQKPAMQIITIGTTPLLVGSLTEEQTPMQFLNDFQSDDELRFITNPTSIL